MEFLQAHRYSSHSIRRCAAQELGETGSPISAIASAGAWKPNDVRVYIDMAANVEANVRQLFRVGPESGSDDEVLRRSLFSGESHRPA